MAKRSEQVREVALSVCDRLDVFEGRIVPSGTGIAEGGGTGSSLTGVAGGAPLSVLIDRAGNDELEALLTDAARVRSEFDAILAAGAGVIAKRSERALGYAGLARSAGDRTAVNMVQRLTGSTRGEAFRQVKLGEAMGEADAASTAAAGFPSPNGRADAGEGLFDEFGVDGVEPGADPGVLTGPPVRPVPVLPWHEPLTRAARDGILRTEAVTIVMRGLGEPNDRVDAEMLRDAAAEIVADAAGVHADSAAQQIPTRPSPTPSSRTSSSSDSGHRLEWSHRRCRRRPTTTGPNEEARPTPVQRTVARTTGMIRV